MKIKTNKPVSGIIYSMFIILLLSACSESTVKIDDVDDNEKTETTVPYTEGTARIAKWKDNKKAALNLQFDDSTPGQATLGIPALNERNLTGTWYVNPGRDEFNNHIDYWKNAAYEGGQELANHTMTHTGAATYEETVYEVGEASKIIWELRRESEYGSLIAFNRGGGTSWNEYDLAMVLDDYRNIDRQSYTGIKVIAFSVPSGSKATDLIGLIPLITEDSIIGRLNFHGIAVENGNPPYDYGNAAIWIEEFEDLLDRLVEVENEIWIDGYSAVYKYIKERETAAVTMEKYTDEKLSVHLTSDMDETYYNEALTVLAELPQSWTNCIIKQEDKEETVKVNNGIAMFNAVPNKGEILLIKN